MKNLLLVLLLLGATASVCMGELVVIPMPDMIGEVPPSISADISFPDDLADVDSVGVRFVGHLTEGLGIFWNETEPEPLRKWPGFMLEIDGDDGFAGGHVPWSVPPGDVDVTFTLNCYFDDEFTFHGCNGYIWCDIVVWTLWDVLVYPTAQVTQVDLLLWTSTSSPVESTSWSSIKALFDEADHD